MRIDDDIGHEHARSHLPGANDDDSWQESWALAWFDPVAGISGWHHASVKWPLGNVDLKSWVCARGTMVHGYQKWDLPIPDQDFTNITLGPIHLQSLEPFRREQVSIHDQGCALSLSCEPVLGPHWYNRKSMELGEAKSHWEGCYRFAGEAGGWGETVAVTGFAFLARSWGPRDLGTLLSFRNICAMFGEDLMVRLLMPVTRSGPQSSGFVIDRGELWPLRSVDIAVTMSADGANPLGCVATIWTDGGGYELRGATERGHAQINTHAPDEMYSHASCVFRLGGRLGTGFLQVNELKRPAPWDSARLGL